MLAVMHRGELVAVGTLEDLRRQASAEGASLEEIFLRITRGATDEDIERVLSR